MPSVTRRDQYYVTSYVTGPQYLRLMLDLQPKRINDPIVTPLGVCALYGNPDDATVQAAVLAGTDEANAEFATSWHPLEIKYSYSGYDNKQCRLMRRAAYDVIKELARNGPDAIEKLTEHPSGLL